MSKQSNHSTTNLSLKKVLKYSPYNKFENESIHKIIGENTFEEELFCEIEEFRKAEKKLVHFVEEGNWQKSWVVLHGFSGNGKTTFIHWFKKAHSEFSIHYLDCSLSTVPAEPKDDLEDRSFLPIKSALIKQLESNEKGSKLMTYLTTHERKLTESFTNDFFKILRSYVYPVGDFQHDVNLINILKEVDFSDVCQLYYLNILLSIEEGKTPNRIIVTFDNLDRLNLEKVAASFVRRFKNIQQRITDILKKCPIPETELDLELVTTVFVLRDANYAIMNPQFSKIIEIGDIDFTLLDSCDEIIQKRLDFADKKSAITDKETRKLFELISKDRYFKKFFQPLVNFDYRRLVSYTFDIIEADLNNKVNLGLDLFSKLYQSNHRSGARGILYHGFCWYLWKRDFLKDFGDIANMNPAETEGFCNPDRVILTILMNMNNFQMNVLSDNSRIKYAYNYTPVSVKSLLDKITGYYKENSAIYDVDTVLDIFEKYFFMGQDEDLCNIITLQFEVSEMIQGRGDYISSDLRTMLREFGEKYKDIKAKRTPYSHNNENMLENLKVSLNPAGFIYLNNILVHYEFYSNWMRFQRKVTEDKPKPLFNDTDFNFVEGKYNWQTNILNVLSLIEGHVKHMNNFFEIKYKPFLMNLKDQNVEVTDYAAEFYNSPLSYWAYKYDLEHNQYNIDIQNRKEFHSTRVLSSHIGYLDDFRLFLLNDIDFNNYNENNVWKWGNEVYKNKYQLHQINKIMIDYIKRYLKLMDLSIDKNLKTRILDPLYKATNIIEKSDYMDFRTKVVKNYYSYLETK
jgi:hypothetical protein